MASMSPSHSRTTLKRLAGGLVLALLATGLARAGEDAKKAPVTDAALTVRPSPNPPARKPTPYRPVRLNTRAKEYFQAAWGVDRMKVSRVASGSLIRFTFRVSDPAQAAPLADRNATPVLFAQRTRALLSVPVMEKIGPLRQAAGTLKPGQEYWVAFSNKGNLVRSGDKVNVIIGRFHADGLMVE